jgi:hypothetical protein
MPKPPFFVIAGIVLDLINTARIIIASQVLKIIDVGFGIKDLGPLI